MPERRRMREHLLCRRRVLRRRLRRSMPGVRRGEQGRHLHHGQRCASWCSRGVCGHASELRGAVRGQSAQPVQLCRKRGDLQRSNLQQRSCGEDSLGVQRVRRLHREQRGSLHLGQVLHGRCLRDPDCERRFLPEQQSVYERELFERPLLFVLANRMWKLLRLPFQQQRQLRELRPFLCRGLVLFRRILLPGRRPVMHDRPPVLERRLQHLLCGFRRRRVWRRRGRQPVRHHTPKRLRQEPRRLLRQ